VTPVTRVSRLALGWLVVLAGRGLAGCGDVTADVIVRAPAEGECRSDADCVDAAGEPRCELESGDCVACIEVDDCGAGATCALPANVCVPRCDAGGACNGAAPVCDEQTGLCRACSSDDDCPDGAPRCLGSGACAECLVADDCTDRSGSNEGEDEGDRRLCSSAGRCVECLDDGHCDDVGETCSTVLGECARPCSAPADCNDGDAPICDLNVGYCVECRTDQECEEDELCRGSECVDED